MSDLEIITLSITSECLGIDSENLLWCKIKKDYSKYFPNLIHRTRYNARRKTLRNVSDSNTSVRAYYSGYY